MTSLVEINSKWLGRQIWSLFNRIIVEFVLGRIVRNLHIQIHTLSSQYTRQSITISCFGAVPEHFFKVFATKVAKC